MSMLEFSDINFVLVFYRSPSFPLIQDTALKGKLSVPELRVTRLMNRSISCTMKNPKGELFSYPPNSQVSASSKRSMPKCQIPFHIIFSLFSPSHVFNVSCLLVKLWPYITTPETFTCNIADTFTLSIVLFNLTPYCYPLLTLPSPALFPPEPLPTLTVTWLVHPFP